MANIDKIIDSKKLLPQNAIFKSIEGGNHSQFGNYGFQKGDGVANISSIKQQELTTKYTTNILELISNKE